MAKYTVKTNYNSRYAKVKRYSKAHAIAKNANKIIGLNTTRGNYFGVVKDYNSRSLSILDFELGKTIDIPMRIIDNINAQGLNMEYRNYAK